MSKKRCRPEEMISKLREVDILVGQGRTVTLATKEIGDSEVGLYRWRQEYGVMSIAQNGDTQFVKTGTHNLCVPVSS